MEEHNLGPLLEVFVLGRITYVTLFLHLKKDGELKIDGLISRAYKQALGLTITAPTERFEALGAHNTLTELIGAQRLAQRERLSYSQTVEDLSAHRPTTMTSVTTTMGLNCDR